MAGERINLATAQRFDAVKARLGAYWETMPTDGWTASLMQTTGFALQAFRRSEPFVVKSGDDRPEDFVSAAHANANFGELIELVKTGFMTAEAKAKLGDSTNKEFNALLDAVEALLDGKMFHIEKAVAV